MFTIADKYLLILDSGSGFWQEMHHVLGQLLAAELTGRIPVVCWRKNSLYGIEEGENAFAYFFLPVSEFTPADLEGRDVVVHDTAEGIEAVLRLLEPEDPLRGVRERALYRLLLKKYIHPQPYIQKEINAFRRAHIPEGPVIGVHIRGSDKIVEQPDLHMLNTRYPAEVEACLCRYPGARIFLMTDCVDILEEYRACYGDRLVGTDCLRVNRFDTGAHFRSYADRKRKGIEIIKDTWLAAGCDCFVGNGYSNVSRAVSELADWPESELKLLY